jgi:small subunit ribosomal protein S5
MAGLESLRTPDEVADIRGLSVNQVLGLTSEPASPAPDAALASEPTPGAPDAEGSNGGEGSTPRGDADAGSDAAEADEPEAATEASA